MNDLEGILRTPEFWHFECGKFVVKSCELPVFGT